MDLANQTEIVLKYSGSDVNNGTITADDLVSGLEGLKGAYQKLAQIKDQDSNFQLRVSGIRKGSTQIMLIWEWIGNNSLQLQAIGTIGAFGYMIVPKMFNQIVTITKHVAKLAYKEKFEKNKQEVTIINHNNISITVPLDAFNIFREETIAPDLSKIVKPLAKNKIDSATVIAKVDSDEQKEVINIEEKPYFIYEQPIEVKKEEIWLKGNFISLNKKSNRGTFLLESGAKVPYQFATDKPAELYPLFVYNGLVEVRCIAHLNQIHETFFMSILEIKKLQGDFNF